MSPFRQTTPGSPETRIPRSLPSPSLPAATPSAHSAAGPFGPLSPLSLPPSPCRARRLQRHRHVQARGGEGGREGGRRKKGERTPEEFGAAAALHGAAAAPAAACVGVMRSPLSRWLASPSPSSRGSTKGGGGRGIKTRRVWGRRKEEPGTRIHLLPELEAHQAQRGRRQEERVRAVGPGVQGGGDKSGRGGSRREQKKEKKKKPKKTRLRYKFGCWDGQVVLLLGPGQCAAACHGRAGGGWAAPRQQKLHSCARARPSAALRHF